MLEQLEKQFTKYEIARILGARSLQISMDAPLLLKISKEELESFNYNPIEIAKRELVAEVLRITVNKPLPKKKEATIKKLTKEEIEALRRREKEKEELELKKEGKEIKASEDKEEGVVVADETEQASEMMELANPEDEVEESSGAGEEEGV